MRTTLLAGIALALGACGGASLPEAAPGVAPLGEESPTPYVVDPKDPCSVLSAEEVAEAIAREVTSEDEVESRPDQEGRTVPLCHYATTQPYGSVVVYLEEESSEDDFRARMRRDPINTEEVEDLGDLAFFHGGVSLSVLVADASVSMSVQMFDTVEEAQVALRNVAEIAVERLRG